MRRIAVTGTVVVLLLCSVVIESQQRNNCRPITPKQRSTLCGYTSPIYPPEAKAAGVEGTVVIFAQVNKTGGIDWARAVSGPEPLRQGAVDAVRAWNYRPVLLYGSPHGFRTLVRVKFTIEKPPTQPPSNN